MVAQILRHTLGLQLWIHATEFLLCEMLGRCWSWVECATICFVFCRARTICVACHFSHCLCVLCQVKHRMAYAVSLGHMHRRSSCPLHRLATELNSQPTRFRLPGRAIGVVISVVQFCHRNESDPQLTQRAVVFTFSKLEPLAALGRLHNPPARYMFAYAFRLFLLTTTYCAPPTRTASRTTVSTYHTNTSLRVLQSRSQLVTSIASVKEVVRACSNSFLNPSDWGQLRAQCPTWPLALVPLGRMRRRKSDFATAPGSRENRNSTKDLAFSKSKNNPQCFFVVAPNVFHDYTRAPDPPAPKMVRHGKRKVNGLLQTASTIWTSPLQARCSR